MGRNSIFLFSLHPSFLMIAHHPFGPHPPTLFSPGFSIYLHTGFWLPVKHPYQLDMCLVDLLVLSVN